MGVAKNLDFHVPGLLDVLLDVDGTVPERLLRLTPRGLERRFGFRRTPNQAHALPAPTGRGLEEHGKPDPPSLARRFAGVLEGRGEPRHDRHARVLHPAPGLRLVTHRLDGLG